MVFSREGFYSVTAAQAGIQNFKAEGFYGVIPAQAGIQNFKAEGFYSVTARESGNPEVRSHWIKLDCCPAQE